MIVLDTSALIYWTAQPDRLSEKAAEAIKEADRIMVSAISIWEIALKVKQGKLDLLMPLTEYVNRLEQAQRLEILPVDVPVWLKNVELAWDHRDPADRTLVAQAQILDCALVTSDQRIQKYYPKAVW